MEKRFSFIESSDISSPASSSTCMSTNWNKCLFCQKDTTEKLTCPADFTGRFQGNGYKSIAENLETFAKLGCLPSKLNISVLNEGAGLETTFQCRRAKFHKTCSLQFNKNELKRAEKRKSSSNDGTELDAKKKFTRQKATDTPVFSNNCLFCELPATSQKPLHEASTFRIDTRVRQCALNLQDEKLLAKLSHGDMIAIEAKYHSHCLAALYNKDRPNASQESSDNTTQSTAFAELISYMCSVLENEDITPVFKVSDLKTLYTDRINQLGGNASALHSTRFKEKILTHFPELEAHSEGRDVLLVRNDFIGKSLRRACHLDSDDEALCLSQAANIIRRDMVENKCTPFDGSFPEDCQEKSVSPLLLTLVTMIMFGTNIKNQANYMSQPSLSLAQLLTYNTCIRRWRQSKGTRHLEWRETPLPLFLGTLVHCKTRSRTLVETLNKLGLSVSYDRVLGLSADLGNSVINHFESTGTVCPPSLNTGVFTTSAVDNIDHNPSATSAQGSFHGTGISLFQHPDLDNAGTKQERDTFLKSGKTISKLPDSYTMVPPVTAYRKELPLPDLPGLVRSDGTKVKERVGDEYKWCEHVTRVIETELNSQDEKDLHVSWAAYHANEMPAEIVQTPPLTTSALLPLFPDDSKSVAMIKHSMDVVKKAVTFLNPGQVPVLTCDQPLFKLAKEIQWIWPDIYGEENFIIILGGLHIKMALQKALGTLLDGSGWTSALVQADITTPGTADSFLKASHVKRTARVHQITCSALFKLQQDAYAEYQSSDVGGPPMPFLQWCDARSEQSPQFHYWQLIRKVIIDVMVWDNAIHTGNFPLYVDALTNLEWLFYALDRYNYARVVAVHLRDMVTLQNRHPDAYEQFCQGKFTVNKSHHPFSRIPLDESHEQNNAIVKGDGGAVGLTENPSALLRWMVAGPEMARVVSEFFRSMDRMDVVEEHAHHEDKPGKVILYTTNT